MPKTAIPDRPPNTAGAGRAPTDAIGRSIHSVLIARDAGSVSTVLLSMTGHGEAHRQHGDVAIGVEIRAINGRYLKVSVRTPEGLASLERQVEPIVRRFMRRGSVQAVLRIDMPAQPDDYRINKAVLAGYLQQIDTLSEELRIPSGIRLDTLLALPGAIDEGHDHAQVSDALWGVIEETLIDALRALEAMRGEEGAAMAADLAVNCREIGAALDRIEGRAPTVVENYRTRLTERINQLLAGYDAAIEPSDVVREVGMFTERTDISEEIVRMRSHLEQFDSTMRLPESSGRKLEFLTQEMFRETNTIGSKANDAEIAQHVVEIKAAIERMREMIQNVE